MPDCKSFLIAPITPTMEFAQVTATSEALDMPASNLLLPHPTDWFVAPVVAGLEITVNLDLEVGDQWGFIAPLYTNFGPSCSWVALAAPTEEELDTGPTFQTDPIPGQLSSKLFHRSYDWVHSFAWTDAVQWLGQGLRTEPWLKILVTTVDPKLPRGYVGVPYVQWGNLVVADPWQPPFSTDRAGKQRVDEKPKKSKMFAGGNRVIPRRRPRKSGYTIGFLTRQESLDFVDELDRRVGQSGHVVTIYDPLDLESFHREMIYGTLGPTDRTHVNTDVYKKPLTVMEAYA
jgi:hypothetical protein